MKLVTNIIIRYVYKQEQHWIVMKSSLLYLERCIVEKAIVDCIGYVYTVAVHDRAPYCDFNGCLLSIFI